MAEAVVPASEMRVHPKGMIVRLSVELALPRENRPGRFGLEPSALGFQPYPLGEPSCPWPSPGPAPAAAGSEPVGAAARSCSRSGSSDWCSRPTADRLLEGSIERGVLLLAGMGMGETLVWLDIPGLASPDDAKPLDGIGKRGLIEAGCSVKRETGLREGTPAASSRESVRGCALSRALRSSARLSACAAACVVRGSEPTPAGLSP
jgi:hypothetical protein